MLWKHLLLAILQILAKYVDFYDFFADHPKKIMKKNGTVI